MLRDPGETARLLWARMEAASHETSLSPARRKGLGQFFTGIPLSRLLAALSVRRDCRVVIDPMAGTGDLLEAVIERSQRKGGILCQLDGIEICDATAAVCLNRLAAWEEALGELPHRLVRGSAFAPETLSELPFAAYDLVITNPPYVRYQTVSRNGRNSVPGGSADVVRQELLRAVESYPLEAEMPLWRAILAGYSGLADLSVPAWLLGAMLVRPGGTLALVAPATWRSRDYADVLLYLLARFFRLDAVVADRQRGWFSSALVRTHLVIATRLQHESAVQPIAQRERPQGVCQWVEIAPDAQGGESLVGGAFPSDDPERDFADWLFSQRNAGGTPKGVSRAKRSHASEVATVLSRCSHSNWLPKVEPFAGDLPLFSNSVHTTECAIPQSLSAALGFEPRQVCRLENTGISVSQGLRTGCNDFFYVDWVEDLDEGSAIVRLSKLFGRECLSVPSEILVPVVRRQADLNVYQQDLLPPGRVLDLRNWVLPEDRMIVDQARDIYSRLQRVLPSVMPEELSDHVRQAAKTRRGGKQDASLIPELTAVQTNVRSTSSGSSPRIPRFWYMLPDFVRRHVPDMFVPRVNQLTPLALPNRPDRIVVDANFSTLWSNHRRWTPTAMTALLRSTWVRACMEAVGTPMGGGALKLEATHLKRLPIPRLGPETIRSLDALGDEYPAHAIDHIIFGVLIGEHSADGKIIQLRERVQTFIDDAQLARQRK